VRLTISFYEGRAVCVPNASQEGVQRRQIAQLWVSFEPQRRRRRRRWRGFSPHFGPVFCVSNFSLDLAQTKLHFLVFMSKFSFALLPFNLLIIAVPFEEAAGRGRRTLRTRSPSPSIL